MDPSLTRKILKSYSQGNLRIGLFQIFSSIILFGLLWWLAIIVAPISLWLSALFSAINGLLLTRIFVLQHDCGHYSLFPEKSWNDFFGNILSVATLTPLLNWRREHNLHHSHIGNLDKVEHGDFWLLTVEQYQRSNLLTKIKYRIYRSPLILFIVGPTLYLTLRRRFPVNLPYYLRRERNNVWFTNLGIFLFYFPLLFVLGPKVFFVMFLPTFVVGSSICTWGFFVQHSFKNGYWEREKNWDYYSAALSGSSYYDLPAWMRWFSADISVHHIHHAEASIPNYNLQKCLKENPELKPRNSLTFMESLSCVNSKLWDEKNKKFVRFSEI